MSKTIYKALNLNGKFDHLEGKQAAINYARHVEKDETLTEQELIRDFGWTFTKLSAAEAKTIAGI